MRLRATFVTKTGRKKVVEAYRPDTLAIKCRGISAKHLKLEAETDDPAELDRLLAALRTVKECFSGNK